MDNTEVNREYALNLRERFMEKGADDLNDRELLCLLLSFTNVKNRLLEVTNALMERFQNADNCYTATYSELMDVDGMTRHSAIIIMLMGRLAALRSDGMTTARSIGEYEHQFRTLLRYTMREELWAAALDDDGAVRALERLSYGSDVNVEVSVGALMRFAVKSNAKRVLIAHCHPEAPEPIESETDVYSRKYLAAALSAVGVTLEGQVIVAGGKAKIYHISEMQ